MRLRIGGRRGARAGKRDERECGDNSEKTGAVHLPIVHGRTNLRSYRSCLAKVELVLGCPHAYRGAQLPLACSDKVGEHVYTADRLRPFRLCRTVRGVKKILASNRQERGKPAALSHMSDLSDPPDRALDQRRHAVWIITRTVLDFGVVEDSQRQRCSQMQGAPGNNSWLVVLDVVDGILRRTLLRVVARLLPRLREPVKAAHVRRPCGGELLKARNILLEGISWLERVVALDNLEEIAGRVREPVPSDGKAAAVAELVDVAVLGCDG